MCMSNVVTTLGHVYNVIIFYGLILFMLVVSFNSLLFAVVLIGSYRDCLVCSLFGWLVGSWLVGWLVGWLVCWSVGWLDGWLFVGWLAGGYDGRWGG